MIITFGLLAAAAALAFGFVRGALPVLLVGCLMSFFGIGADPAVKVYTAESYPTQVRAAGTSLTEGFGRLLSGVIGPSFIPLLLAAGGVAAVYTLVGAVALVAVVVVAFFGEETRGRPLEAITRPAVSRPGTTPGAAHPSVRGGAIARLRVSGSERDKRLG